MYTSAFLLASAAALLSQTTLAAPTGYQQPLEDRTAPAAEYPYRNDPYDRKHDTYADDVQPLPVVRLRSVFRCSIDTLLLTGGEWWIERREKQC